MSEEQAASRWAQTQERGTYLGIRFMLGAYRLIGRTGFRIVLVPVILYFFLFNRTARNSSLAFLRRVHAVGGGPWSRTARPGLWQSFRHFMSFGEALLDKAAAWAGDFQQTTVRYNGREMIETWQEAGRGAVFLTSHLGNIEVFRALSMQRTHLRLNILVHTRHAENFNRMLHDVGAYDGVRLIEVTEFDPAMAIELQKRVTAGEFVVVASDRTPVTGGRTRDTEFLGETAPFPLGGAMIAAILRCPVGMITAVRNGKDFYLTCEPLADFSDMPRTARNREIDRVVDRFAEKLGQHACAYPYQWFNFFDFWQSRAKPAQPHRPDRKDVL